MFSHFFIRRPIFAGVVSIVIVLAGLVAIANLPVAQYPEIAPPQVLVTAIYPGATAEAIQRTVAAPIEEQINGVEGMLYITTVASGGVSTTTVTFEVGTDVDLAANNVANRVRLAEPSLPEEVRRNGVTVQKQNNAFIQIVTLLSPDGRLDPVFLSNYASLNVVEPLKRVPGVGQVQVFGARDYSMRIWLRPDVLAEYGLTTADVARAVREQNAQFAVGRIGQEPTSPDLELTYTVTAEDRLQTPEQFAAIVLRADPTGRLLRLGDVARIELGARDYDREARLNGKPAIFLGVFLQPGANALATAEGVIAQMEELAKRFPAGLEYRIPFDTTRFVEVSITEVLKTLGEAMLLVFLVVYLFLQSFRATLIPMLAVPVSLIGTFAGMYALGFSINTLTLFGLVLAIGIVVDDAIVVLENTERIMATEGKSAREAAFLSMREVTGPVVAIVLVLCSVFVPVAFLGGLPGQLYRQFAITIAMSVTISGLVALTLTPALCALVLREPHQARGFFAWFNRVFARGTDRYVATVDGLLRRSWLGAVLFAVLLAATWGLFRTVPTSLVPAEDQGYFIAVSLLPDGATLARTSRVSQEVEQFLLADPAVESVAAINGIDIVGGGSNAAVSTMFVVLKRWHLRETPELSLDATLGRFFAHTGQIKEALIFAFNPPPIQGLGNTGGFEVYLQNRGEVDTARLASVAGEFLGALNQDPRLLGARTLFRANSPQINVHLDRAKAKALGVPVDEVFTTLQTAFGTLYVNDFDKLGRVFRVVMQAEADFRSRPEDLARLWVRSEAGAMVPLGSLLQLDYGAGAETLERFNLYPSIKLLGAAAPGRSSAEALGAVEELAAAKLPPDFSVAWTGSAFEEKRSGGASAQVLLFGMVFVFLILAAQYERWSLPLAVMLTVPFALFGALAAVQLRGMPNDVYFQIGLVTLVGLAAKNAILIVEFAAQQLDAGKSVREAALEASRLRFRPIIMTSLAFILGVLPLAISSGAGAAARRSMGTGVVGGMLAATVIAVAFVPLFFVWVSRRDRRREGGAVDQVPGDRGEDVDAVTLPGLATRSQAAGSSTARLLSALVVLPLALLGVGCRSVGPDYQRPPVELPAAYQEAAAAAAPGEAAAGVAIADAWWQAFGDPTLDALVAAALERNRDLAVAVARVEEARALAGLAAADRLPAIDLVGSAGRSKVSLDTTPLPPGFPAERERYQLGAAFSWELDFWGRVRRANEAALAELLASEEAARAVRLGVVAEVTTAYLDLVTFRRQLDLATDTLGTRREAVELQRARFEAGTISELDLAQAEAELAATEATVPAVERQLEQTVNRLDVLLGRAGGTITPGLALAAITVPEVPVGLPSTLLERRPDVVAAEQRLVAANARIGVARAAYFPTISLTAGGGTESEELGDLFAGGTSFWNAALGLVRPLFDAGRTRRQVAAAEARRLLAEASYAKTLETAFAEVEDALVARRTGEAERAARSRQVRAQARALELAELRYEAGDAAYIEVLDAQRSSFRAELDLIAARRGELAAAVALFRALGGGFTAAPAEAADRE
jgi:multidrug efflux pump